MGLIMLVLPIKSMESMASTEKNPVKLVFLSFFVLPYRFTRQIHADDHLKGGAASDMFRGLKIL